MVKKVLELAGFIEGKTYRETRFVTPPRTSYAIFLDECNIRGADSKNLVEEHTYTIELYTYKPDPEAEERLAAALDTLAQPYTMLERDWLEDEQLYMVVYTFDYINKRRTVK